MSDSFIIRKGSKKINNNRLMLIKDGDMMNGLTGFKYVNTPYDCGLIPKTLARDTNIVFNNPQQCMMYKSYSFASDKPDSFIISTNETIDLTNYNYIMFNFYSGTNYGSGDYNNFGGGYFRIDEPENLPINNAVYNWDGWDVVFTQNRVINLFIKDITKIKGQHNLCFGLSHGQYTSAYTNYFVFNNLCLI